jgi:hypothetical protein
MIIQLTEFKPSNTYFRTGFAVIMYGDLKLNCEVRVTKDKKHIWIKMPTAIGMNKLYYNCCHWPEKKMSDIFQKEVLQQLAAKYPEALKIPTKTENNKMNSNRKKMKKGTTFASPMTLKDPPKQPFPIGKARHVSKFSTKKF